MRWPEGMCAGSGPWKGSWRTPRPPREPADRRPVFAQPAGGAPRAGPARHRSPGAVAGREPHGAGAAVLARLGARSDWRALGLHTRLGSRTAPPRTGPVAERPASTGVSHGRRIM